MKGVSVGSYKTESFIEVTIYLHVSVADNWEKAVKKGFANFSVKQMQMATRLVVKAQYAMSFMETLWVIDVSISVMISLKSKCCVLHFCWVVR